MPVLILPTQEGWKAEWALAGKKVTQIFNPQPGQELNWEPQDWEAEILTTAPTPALELTFQTLALRQCWQMISTLTDQNPYCEEAPSTLSNDSCGAYFLILFHLISITIQHSDIHDNNFEIFVVNGNYTENGNKNNI